MSIATEEDARAVLTPEREAKLHHAFHDAWRDVSSDLAKYGIWPRTRANMIFERLATWLQEQFADDPDVEFSFRDETVKITFDDFLLVRCKKANVRGLGQNVPTQAVMTFCDAEEELALFPGLRKIEILYVLNRIGTSIENVVVQARDGDMRLWAYAINGAGERESAPITPFPLAPDPHTESNVVELVQPRKRPADEEDADKK